MNTQEVALLKRGLDEYCENTFGMCLGYFKKHNIDYNLTGNDELSNLLKEVNNIQINVINVTDINLLYEYRNRLFKINRRVSEIIGG